jgi:hypothetical protein
MKKELKIITRIMQILCFITEQSWTYYWYFRLELGMSKKAGFLTGTGNITEVITGFWLDWARWSSGCIQ